MLAGGRVVGFEGRVGGGNSMGIRIDTLDCPHLPPRLGRSPGGRLTAQPSLAQGLGPAASAAGELGRRFRRVEASI